MKTNKNHHQTCSPSSCPYSRIGCFPDNDRAGQTDYENLKKMFGDRLRDMSKHYAEHKYNRENEMCIFSKRNVHFLYFFRGFSVHS